MAFGPPIPHGMQVLDRSFFQKLVPLKAARIFDNKHISKIRSQLERSKDALQQDRITNVHQDPDTDHVGKKCILLRPEISYHNTSPTPWPHSPILAELTKQELISIIPYDLKLTYDYWSYHEIISTLLPADAKSEIPSGFSQVGHVVHMNLRDAYLPYKHLIASIILDKNPGAKTVINKIDDVGEENEFRTFKYEVLAGEDDLNVVVSEAGCEFRFDYSKVYWNPRLGTEHHRIVEQFKEGEAVCDVMAGIGPFAVPAGKKGVFVFANDLNPDSYAGLTDAVKRNRVGDWVRPSCADGRVFIRDSAAQLLEEDEMVVEVKKKISRSKINSDGNGKKEEVIKRVARPRTFQHYVLNLPASALTFLPSFVSLYPPELRKKLHPDTKMPVIHVYCFSTKDELAGDPLEPQNVNGNGEAVDGAGGEESQSAELKICAEISEHLGFRMRPGKNAADAEGIVEIWDVRDVAPKKRMFCATFRLPEEVAFR